MTESAPLGLKEPVRWNNSSFSHTSVPAPTARATASSTSCRTGVVTTRSPSLARFARMASIVGMVMSNVRYWGRLKSPP
jgi:hypothetical protein